MPTERNELPGGPSNRLIKDVRKVLWRYLRSRPERASRAWVLAWEWANNIRYRNGLYLSKPKGRWPMPNGIASQYLFLVLTEMKDKHALRLPFNAAECVPDDLLPRLTGLPSRGESQLLISSSPFESEINDASSP